MKKFFKYGGFILYGLAAMLCVVFIVSSALDNRPYIQEAVEARPEKLTFSGSYAIKGQPETPLADGQIKKYNSAVEEEVVLRGHFNQTVKAGTNIYFRIYHFGVVMLQNGEEIYAYGQPGTYSSHFRSLGDLWDEAVLERDILPDDTIEFRLDTPVDIGKVRTVVEYNQFLDNLYASSRGQMIRAVLADNWPHVFMEIFLLTNGLALWLGAMALKLTKVRFDRVVFNGSYLLIIMGLWMMTGGQLTSLLTSYDEVVMAAEYSLLFLMMAFIFRYIAAIVESCARLLLKGMEYASVGLLVLCVVFQMTGVMDGFEFQSICMLPILLSIVGTIICLAREYIRSRKTNAGYIMVSVMVLGLFFSIGIIQIMLAQPRTNLWYDIGIFIFAVLQMLFIFRYVRQKFMEARDAERAKQEVLEAQMQLMVSQIRPHFIFNTLNAISALCLEDPVKADEAIIKFSKYLRANIDMLGGRKFIPFTEEIEHIKNYVSIEQIRFSDRIKAEYQLEYTAFEVPMLSIQPIVENAIKHGLQKKKEGGTVVLASRRTETGVRITVTDDGVGFDVDKLNARETSAGMKNIKTRLQIYCDASIDIQSAPDKGTCVSVEIPVLG